LSRVGAGTPYPNLAHFVLGLQSVPFTATRDYVAVSVLNTLMGGGCHFSSGGPGKGMYTRLYTDVLNLHHWLYNATSYNHSYSDSGLYCIHASASPDQLASTVRVVVEAVCAWRKRSFEKQELQRAKVGFGTLSVTACFDGADPTTIAAVNES
jgi:processing peptidase subunit alpha